MSVKTRFAPSPTGSLHIGGARTALFNWLYACRNGGKFVLRIEDTDTERSTSKSLSEIVESLKWLGIECETEPLRQSGRLKIYNEFSEKLLTSGAAFKCWMTPEDLESEKKAAESAGGHFRYKREWAERGKKEGAPFAVRFAVPQTGADGVNFTDLLRGGMSFPAEDVEDFVIIRSDGMPTYNFASAIDDALTEITHVIRGDEHLVNTPKQILLQKALNFTPPSFVHLPVILAPDGTKLSKRHGAVSVSAFREKGFLPSALANYIARLGWSHGDDEIFTLSELVEKFDIKGLGTSPSNFDEEKMRWVNGVHIRDGKCDVVKPLRDVLKEKGFNVSQEDAEKAYELMKERAETVVEMAEKSLFLFRRKRGPLSRAVEKNLVNENSLYVLEQLLLKFEREGEEGFNEERVKSILTSFAEEKEMKLKHIAQPLRAALTRSAQSPGIFEVVAGLKRDESIARIKQSINVIKKREERRKVRVIGICGNLCSGKSTVAQILGELGAKIIDADEVSRAVSVPGTPVFEKIVLAFGNGVLDSGGSIDRAKLGDTVFSDPEKRKVLERITHPAIRDEVVRRVGEESAGGAKVVVIEAALLSRSKGVGRFVDILVLVEADEKVKFERAAKRDGFSSDEVRKRLDSQSGRGRVNPDFVIDNSGGVEELREKVEKLWEGFSDWRGESDSRDF